MNPSTYWLLRQGQKILVLREASGEIRLPTSEQLGGAFSPVNPLFVGDWAGQPCYAADFEQPPRGLPLETVSVRQLFGMAGEEAFALAGRATQLLDWQNNHHYCGRCGQPTERKAGEFALQCPRCHLLAYPRISPAVMVLVRRGEELLLARSPHFPPGIFSALAGFVEAGETLEQCAAREVREEVGIEIRNLRYFGSQSWPFPNSLMVAFVADYAGGELRLDPVELEAGNWFPRSGLPPLPDPVSIARRLIEAVCRSEI